ncbi:hypothetical protein KUTeg_019952 [Tegillarca granosa]|uniref:Uncharacterized protein n=1 Tax=Tegillarca granosa TaxID=220873 RepID=A0ABQ9EGL4_TEGGR|nr:hypothetical protein KUTeg_019952 [Tegillarca granosa]
MGITRNPEWESICVLGIISACFVKRPRDMYTAVNQEVWHITEQILKFNYSPHIDRKKCNLI